MLGGRYVGIPHSEIESTMRMIGTEDQRSMFQRIKVMEFAALGVLDRRQ